MPEARQTSYIYTYACHEDERELCRLELSSLLMHEPGVRHIGSSIGIDPRRSPFLHERLTVMFEAESLKELANSVRSLDLGGATFKLLYMDADTAETYEQKRTIERRIGAAIVGKAEMKRPDRLLGIAFAGGRWVLGDCVRSEAVWLQHGDKPRQYSTALSTRVARAVVNIAAPHPEGKRLIDPCCGIGTVLVEALSMGMDISGYDINPLAVRGARENLRHFGMPDVVKLGDMRLLEGSYDALILDLPYNLCSVMTDGEQLDMLRSARRLASRAVILTTEEISRAVMEAGFIIAEQCRIYKGRFVRQLLVCQ
ncbi:TRM11 family SAM-dependent methyltransferase [Paenibacillus caui]|uniref:TRM11 family SAM-dependent methyltransferase n=1 Tax=Paenibacillus caui TaxID=2873927 RepID=UPI001CAA1844|nr:RsmD family RNA methyltransferase [Paenibacillus caui]